MKKIMILLLLVAMTASGCSALSAEVASNKGSVSEEWFSDRDLDWTYDAGGAIYIKLNGETAECSAKEVEIDANIVNIIDEGVFVVSGTLNDGMIHVLCEKKDKVQIVLDNAQVTSATCAPIYVHQADKVFITLKEGTQNSLVNGGSFEPIDENNIDAVIFSKEDLTLNGSGELSISSPAGHGIVGKDDLTIAGGNYTIESTSHGVSAKDNLAVTGCEMSIDSGKDGLHCENEEDADKGNVYVRDGKFAITSGGDGLSASGDMILDGGTFDITSGGGSGEAARTEESYRGGFMGRGYQSVQSADTPSTKGLKAARTLTINGGAYDIDAADDGVHSDGDIWIAGGELAISTGDDGVHANDGLTITGGSVNIAQSYEGIEAKDILISGGDIALISSDDGLNAGGGNDASGYGGRWGGDMFSSDGSSITITGGNLYVNAQGDGVDSNGDITVSGGYTLVCGPTGGGNGSLDYAGEATITGGTFVALGSSQMAMNFSSAENQGTMLVSTGSQDAGTQILLRSSAGEEILSITGEKSFSCAVISCPEIMPGETYSLAVGDFTADITMESLIYGSGSGMMMGGRGGMGMGGMGGHGGFGGRGW